jgi:hypothetical protein
LRRHCHSVRRASAVCSVRDATKTGRETAPANRQTRTKGQRTAVQRRRPLRPALSVCASVWCGESRAVQRTRTHSNHRTDNRRHSALRPQRRRHQRPRHHPQRQQRRRRRKQRWRRKRRRRRRRCRAVQADQRLHKAQTNAIRRAVTASSTRTKGKGHTLSLFRRHL